MIRRPPRSTLDRSSAASDVYKRQLLTLQLANEAEKKGIVVPAEEAGDTELARRTALALSLIHISEPTRPY